MKIWATSFVVLFGLAELYQWLKHLSLPLPFFILSGALLAIVSNSDKVAGWPVHLKTNESDAIANRDTDTTIQPVKTAASNLVQSTQPIQIEPAAEPQLPNLQPTQAKTQLNRSISFTIRQPTE